MIPKQVLSKTLHFLQCDWIIVKAYEMLKFSESKADAWWGNEIISVLLRHAQRHSGKFLCWMLSLELHEKI